MIRDTETLQILLDSLRQFVGEVLIPRENEVADTDSIPQDIVEQMQAMGLFGLTLPEEFGGLGVTMEEEVNIAFELGRTSPAFRSYIGTNNGIGSIGILLDGTAEQKDAAAHPLLGRGHARRDLQRVREDVEFGNALQLLRQCRRRGSPVEEQRLAAFDQGQRSQRDGALFLQPDRGTGPVGCVLLRGKADRTTMDAPQPAVPLHSDEIAADRLVADIELLADPLDRNATKRLEKRADALLSIALPHEQSPPPKRSWHRSGRHTTEARANCTEIHIATHIHKC